MKCQKKLSLLLNKSDNIMIFRYFFTEILRLLLKNFLKKAEKLMTLDTTCDNIITDI